MATQLMRETWDLNPAPDLVYIVPGSRLHLKGVAEGRGAEPWPLNSVECGLAVCIQEASRRPSIWSSGVRTGIQPVCGTERSLERTWVWTLALLPGEPHMLNWHRGLPLEPPGNKSGGQLLGVDVWLSGVGAPAGKREPH